ncbi:hypothetical protein DFP73DRAFT_538348 [Morchella snyderi]|nr:hypothetical protein DFP73DRAFT_538348 [Morchella snyderi]
MKLCTVTVAGSALILSAFAIAGPLPPAVNNVVEISQQLIVRGIHTLSSGSSIPFNTVFHAEEEAIVTRSSIPSGVGFRLDTNKRTSFDNTGMPDDSPLHDPGALEDAYKILTPAEIVAYNNLGPVIPSEPLPPVLSSAIVPSDPPPPEFSSGPAVGSEARSVMALGIVEAGDSLQVPVSQAVLGTAGTSQSASTEEVGGDAGSRTSSLQLPAIFEGRSSRRYVPVGVMSSLLAVAVAFVMM